MSTEKKRKLWYHQSFRSEWLEEPEFKGWLKKDVKNASNSYCICCSVTLKNSSKSMLLSHKNTEKHKRNFEAAASACNLSKFLTKTAPSEADNVAKAELLFAGYFSEHNIPFSQVEHLLEVCKKAFPDSKIAKKIPYKRTKLSYLIQDGIAHHEKMRLDKICQEQKFSFIIDESTDVSTTQVLAIVVRYFDKVELNVKDALFDIVAVDNGTAEGLYKAVKSVFRERDIPMENIIGFGCDNCSTMLGHKKGFQKFLKDDLPHVFILGCVCHSFALCASHSVSVLPSYLESFLKNVTSYFSRSSKRQNDFFMIQEVVQVTNHKIPKLAATRWLSRENVISKILEQWDALVLYFQSEAKTDKVDGASKIYNVFQNWGKKHMLCFLQYVLKKVNVLNLEFQSENFRIHKLYSMISTEYKNLLSLFICENCLLKCDLWNIDPTNPSIHKQLSNIYLGGRTMSLLEEVPHGDQRVTDVFKSDCLKFLIELCVQIKQRFPINKDSVVAKLNLLDPNYIKNQNSLTSVVSLASKFKSIVSDEDLNDLDDEFRSLKLNLDNFSSSDYENIPEFWHTLKNIKDGLDQPKFGKLSNFMTNMTVLPHSSACVERIFSQVTLVKTCKTNKMKTETTRDRILSKQHVTKHNANCISWQPSKDLIKDVQQGAVHQRYLARLKKSKNEQEAATLYEDFEQ